MNDDNSIHHNDIHTEQDEEVPLDELVLPTLSSQVGRSAEWTALLNAYRRAAGVPGASYPTTNDDDEEELKLSASRRSSGNLSILCEDSVADFSVGQDNQSVGTSNTRPSTMILSQLLEDKLGHQQQQQPVGYQIALIRGKAGTGKSFLVRRLKQCIVESYQLNFGQQEGANQGAGDCGASYHDDTTISTKSGGFLNVQAPKRPSAESLGELLEGSESDSLNFAELPTGLFAQGSFTHGSTNSPFSAFTESFNEILEQLICDSLVDVDTLRMALADALGSEGALARLVAIVPNLLHVLAENKDVGDRFDTLMDSNTDGQEELPRGSLLAADSAKGILYLLRSFVRALTRVVATYYGGPIVLFLDDAECMDAPSAALLTSLAKETDSQNLLIVLAVRSEMYDAAHLLADPLKTYQDTKRYMEIQLEDLTQEEVHTLVCKAIRRNPSNSEAAKPLSDLIFHRTRGNCFFVVELLRSLKEQELLQFNLNTLQWSYQIEQIQAETSICDNVVDMVAAKLQTLSKEARYVLVMASCLHSTIELEVLSRIVLEYYPKDAGQKWDSWVSDHLVTLFQAIDSCPDTITVEMDVLLTLDSLVACGLMERVLPAANSPKAGNTFKFAHERIRQAALGLIPDQDFCGQMLHVRVGELLREMVLDSGNAQTWMLFACLDHLNKAPDYIMEEHLLELVHLNIQAGEKAVELSAFLPASTYFAAGIHLLRTKPSLTKDDIFLLHQIRTQLSICHYRTGNLIQSKKVANAALVSDVTLQDKLPLYYNLIAIFKAEGNLEEAVNIGIELLNRVGEKFSKKPSKLRIAREKQKVNKLLKSFSEEQLTQLPRCNNELKGAAVNVYAVLFGPMFHLGCPAAVDLLRLRSIYLTLKYGSTDASALAFAYYASHLIAQNDIEGGYKFGKLSLELLKKAETEELTSRTILVANFLSLHWKDPLSQTLDRLMKGYNVGMMNGDIEMAFTNAGLYQTHYYYCGLPLNTGEKDLRKFIRQMEEYGQNKELSQYKPLWQTMLNLMGRGQVDPTTMTGEAMDQVEFEQGKLGVVVMKSYRMQLAYYFGNLDLARSLMDELRPHSNSFVAPFFQTARRFFFALIRIGLARKAPERKRAALLKKINKEDVEWLEARVRKGAINCLHKLLILKAEMATFDSDEDDIGKAFDKAVVTAGRSGFSQDEALANELAASHFLSNGSFQRASDYLTRAHELYQAWGASAKVKQLEEKYVLIKGPSAASSTGGSMRSVSARSRNRQRFRQRFSQRFSNFHKSIESSEAFSVLSSDDKASDGGEKRASRGESALTAATAAMASAA